VSFSGSLEGVVRANMWLRTASRVIVRIASFRAQAFHELERLARAIPWDRYVTAGNPVRFRITSRKSRLYHTGAIAERLTDAIAHRLGSAPAVESSGTDEDEGVVSPAQLFVVRVVHDAFVVSADSSGVLLHQRGYRQAIAKAPLRETLAAAMLIGSEWPGTMPLVDPMCGSGTIPIEAALIARRIAPGLKRSFAFEHWPEFGDGILDRVRDEALSAGLPRCPAPIQGSDRNAGAITASRANATRAGVDEDIEFFVRSLSAMEVRESAPGYVATNPPYGVRVGEAMKLRDLYARFGQVLRRSCPGWHLSMLAANARLAGELRLELDARLQTQNGGIPVKLLVGKVPGPSFR
jgi:putative N6-adenine-specific DNA methylase